MSEFINYKAFYGQRIKHVMASSLSGKTLTCIFNPIDQEMMFEVKTKDSEGTFFGLNYAIDFYNKG